MVAAAKHQTRVCFLMIVLLSLVPTLTGNLHNKCFIATVSSQESIGPISRTAISASVPSFMLASQSAQLFHYYAAVLLTFLSIQMI